MQDGRPQRQDSPLQRLGNSALPPLSKYYYGPAQASPRGSPANENAAFDIPPSLPPRRSPGIPNYPSKPPPPLDAGQWQTYFANLPGFQQPSAPTASQLSTAPYNPNTYGLMPSAQQSPVHPAFRQPATSGISPDTSTWGVKFNSNQGHGSIQPPKPPQLPPRPYNPIGGYPNQSLQLQPEPPPQVSLTSPNPEILQPVAYSPKPSSAPQGHQILSHENKGESQPRPESTTLPPALPSPLPPPPPVPKLPLAYENETQSHAQAAASHPANYHQPQTCRPDTMVSREQHEHQKPQVDQEQHNSSTFEAMPPRAYLQDVPTTYPPPANPHPYAAPQDNRFDQSHTGQLLRQPSVSPVGPGDDIRWVPETNQWESRTPYVPSPQLNRVIPSHGSQDNSTSTAQTPSTASPTTQETKAAQETNQILPETTFSQIPHTTVSKDLPKSQEESIQEPSSSFYWHSPHSSSDTTNEHSQTFSGPTTPLNFTSTSQVQPMATSAMEETDSNTNSQTTNMYNSDLGLYSSSALGFGGPSDWEHFGDYEGEEVDDTELYSRAEPPINMPVSSDFAELPADLPPGDMQHQHSTKLTDAASTGYKSPSLPTDPLESTNTSSATGSAYDREASTKASDEPTMGDPQMQVKTICPTTTQYPGSQPERSSHDFHKVEATMDEAIHAWSHNPSKEVLRPSSTATSDHSSQMQQVNEIHTPMQSDHSRPTSKSESPLRHADQPPITPSKMPASLTEKQGLGYDTPGHDSSENGNQAPSKDASHLGPGQVSHAQEDSPSNIPPLRVGSPLLPKTYPDQGTGASGTTGSPSSGVLDQKPSKRVSLKAVGDDGSARLVVAASPGLPSQKIEASDPYANLDPWAKASLNRYVTMLREESRAETDKDKFKIFEVFINRETRLRAVLYGTDADPPTEKNVPLYKPPVQRTDTTNLASATKALPALPVDAERSPHKSPTLIIAQDASKSNTGSTQEPASNLSTGDQSYVMVEPSDDVQFSPGGRPIVQRASNTSGDTGTSNREANPDAVGSDDNSDTQKPAYTPFRYSQPDAANLSTKRQSYRPYAALKIGSLAVGPKSGTQTQDRDKNQIDLSEKTYVASSKDDGDTGMKNITKISASTNSQNSREPLDLRRFEKADFDPLVSVLPRSGAIAPESISLQDLKRGMEAVPDDFSFIHQSVVTWDARAKNLRENHEKARHARQVESEQRIDALFDDHEIGYGDISELESEFKRSEAATKADEDRLEYQTFVTEVFDLVWTRLHFEIDQLTPLYKRYTDLLNDTLAGKDMYDGPSGRFALAPTMDSLITLHQKLEVRHQKAFQAVLERDRRLKKTELSPWYSLGNVTKVKQLEKQFENAEKHAIVDYCHQRDTRANQLMDALDQNTLRGVGANQDYMELIHRGICRVASQRAFASAPNTKEPDVGLDEVTKAKMVTAALATSSEQIVQTFHVADMLLNVADYEVSVAKAKLANADVATLKRLSEEKAKEDHKLMRDLEHRLALIRDDSRRTNDEIVKLLCFLGVQNGHAEVPQRAPVDADAGHQERLQKALEEAKKRNASKELLI